MQSLGSMHEIQRVDNSHSIIEVLKSLNSRIFQKKKQILQVHHTSQLRSRLFKHQLRKIDKI